MLTRFDKALAALLTSSVVQLVTHFGIAVPPGVEATATVVLTALFVWLVPNKEV